MPNGYQKISVNLSNQVIDALRGMAATESVTVTEILRRSIGTQKFLDDAQRQGKRLIIFDPETEESERVLFM